MNSTPLSDVELLARLVSFDTARPRTSTDAAEFAAEYLQKAGVVVHRLSSPDRTQFNLLARIGPDVSDGLILSGHFDVVPALEPNWDSPPFVLSEQPDRWVGRGTADMKAFVALAMNAAIRALTAQLRRPLILAMTYDEEIGTLGARDLASAKELPFPLRGSAIIGEPTMLRAVRLHKGHLKLRVTAAGKPAHTGSPHLGINAIERMGKVIHKLTELTHQMRDERSETSAYFLETPYPVLSQSVIAGGTAANIVPERCTLDLGIRVLPGQSSDAAIDRIRKLVADCPGCELSVINNSPPLLTPETSPLYTLVRDMMGQRETYGVSYATDAGHLSATGLDCVIWGPGDIANAHQANEFISKDQFQKGGQLLADLIQRWCGP